MMDGSTAQVNCEIPEDFEFLFEEASYIGAYGGRGSAKSHSVAAALVDQTLSEGGTTLCAREIQGSIRDSVKRLLENKIDVGGYRRFYTSTDTEIRSRVNDGLFIFKGLRSTPDSVKSTEGVRRTWIEEANKVSQTSLDLVLPTVMRQPGSKLLCTWNPDLPDDPVDALFRGNDEKTKERAANGQQFEPLPNSIVRELNFDANPFFPDDLRRQMEYDKRRDPDKYNHIWRGKYLSRSEARVFKNWHVALPGEFPTPGEDTVFHYGADWGFSVDPSVLVRCWIDGRTLYIDKEAYAVGCEIDFLPLLFAGRDGATDAQRKAWGPGMDAAWPGVPGAKRWEITADSARPETISYMGRRGFNIKPARKGAGSVEDGIEFLQNFDIVVHPDCTHTIDELSFYSWKTDKLTDKILPILMDKKNHVIDALRYAVEGITTGKAAMWAAVGRKVKK